MDFRQLIKDIRSAKYQHWHTGKKKVTGYTILNYRIDSIDNKDYFLETNQNMNAEGKVFSEKKSWFDYNTGEIFRYQETDFRTNTRITDFVSPTEVHTVLSDKESGKELTIERDSDLVLFETISLHLQSMVPHFLEHQEFDFTLYIPVLALELEKKGLPQSLSKLGMVATLENLTETDTIWGRKKVVTILVQPSSFIIKSILPKEKTEFRFSYLATAPHYLVAFEEGKMRDTLIDLKTTNEH